jgi:hypothetical protein
MALSATTINENGKHWQYAVPRWRCGSQSPEVFSYTWATLCYPLIQPSQQSRRVLFF